MTLIVQTSHLPSCNSYYKKSSESHDWLDLILLLPYSLNCIALIFNVVGSVIHITAADCMLGLQESKQDWYLCRFLVSFAGKYLELSSCLAISHRVTKPCNINDTDHICDDEHEMFQINIPQTDSDVFGPAFLEVCVLQLLFSLLMVNAIFVLLDVYLKCLLHALDAFFICFNVCSCIEPVMECQELLLSWPGPLENWPIYLGWTFYRVL